MSTLRDVRPRLPEIKARAEKATPGPWRTRRFERGRPCDSGTLIGAVAPGHQIVTDWDGGTYPSRDQAFIAAARTDVPALVEALEEAKALLERASTFDCGHEDAEMCRCPLAKTLSAIREALGQ